MLKKIAAPFLAVLMVFAAMATTSAPAEAGRGGRVAAGVAAGIIGLGILGAYAHSRERSYGRVCYQGPRECYWRDRHCFYNRYGDYICRGGDRVCERRTICE
jgi:hypothetical protein